MFTKRKFQAFAYEKQHKKCAELLKSIHENILKGISHEALFLHYKELLVWMDDPLDPKDGLKELADRYHYHLKHAKISFQEHNLLPSVRRGDHPNSEETWPIAIYLDHLRSAHNVGSIIRTVEAFALGEIYFSDQTPYIDHPQVQNASMQAFQWVNCIRANPFNQLSKPLILLETSPEAISLYDFIFPHSFTLIVGNEEYGCSDEVLAHADYLVEIPLRGRKNSLNVANAFAIAASEIHRQRRENNEKEI